jgi:hypothetical protein
MMPDILGAGGMRPMSLCSLYGIFLVFIIENLPVVGDRTIDACFRRRESG